MNDDDAKDDVAYLGGMAMSLQEYGCSAGESYIVAAIWELRRTVDSLEVAIRESAIDPHDIAETVERVRR